MEAGVHGEHTAPGRTIRCAPRHDRGRATRRAWVCAVRVGAGRRVCDPGPVLPRGLDTLETPAARPACGVDNPATPLRPHGSSAGDGVPCRLLRAAPLLQCPLAIRLCWRPGVRSRWHEWLDHGRRPCAPREASRRRTARTRARDTRCVAWSALGAPGTREGPPATGSRLGAPGSAAAASPVAAGGGSASKPVRCWHRSLTG